MAQQSITVRADKPGISISTTLYGIFFEDINWAADGGLYAEMVQNRSFEYIDVFGSQFTPLTAWTLIRRGGATASVKVLSTTPVNDSNPHHVELTIDNGGGIAGIANDGYGGIAVTKGETYNASLRMRRISGAAAPVTISIEKRDGTVLGTSVIDSTTSNWSRFTTALIANATETAARLVITTAAPGTLAMDMISLFPRATFKNRPNGMRADLAQRLVDLQPKFMRFPGGCIVHSNNLATAYRWKTTIGPIENRRWNPNRWGYMQSGGLGFFEFFQLCEDIGATPIPIVPCGVSCHFKSPYQTVPLAELQPWIDDALDLVEYANGSVTSTWGAKRAAAGHPEPFNMEYIGIGNEEWGPEFKERSTLFIKAVREKYPSITIVGTAGPSASGTDFTDLWSYNRAQKTDIVDEHYYQPTSWFLANTRRYDSYSRKDPAVFAGEYASRTPAQKTLSNAVAEAAFMTGLERNGDLVRLSCYAPLFCHVNCNGAPAEEPWNPDLIYFDHYRSYVTPSYHVQALFADNVGHRILPTTLSSGNEGPLYAVTSFDTISGDILLKIVNSGTVTETCSLKIEGAPYLHVLGTHTMLTSGKPDDGNSFAQPDKVAPEKIVLTNVSSSFVKTFPANSVSALRLTTRSTAIRKQVAPPAGDRNTATVQLLQNVHGISMLLNLYRSEHCTIRCLTLDGRLRMNIADKVLPAGVTTLRWNDTPGGERTPAGVYLIEAVLGSSARSIHSVVIDR